MNRVVLGAVLLSTLMMVETWAGTISERPNPAARQGRIVGGNATQIEHHPHQVSLQFHGGNHFCGGSLISHRTVLTAAHCVVGQQPSSIYVRLGSTYYDKGGVLAIVSKLIHHESYDPNTMQYDVGLVVLAASVSESKSIRIIGLASFLPPNGARAMVTGWGTKCFGCAIQPDNLQEVSVRLYHYLRCSSKEFGYGSKVNDTMICGYEENKDACQGDSGGALVYNNLQIGIVSWGYGCAMANYPGVYCNVQAMHDWILNHLQK